MTPDQELQLFRWVAKGDEAAARFLQAITDVAHVWDDVVDRDTSLHWQHIDSAFHVLLVELPANPFYRAYRDQLEAIIQTAIINWRTATAIEREPGGPTHVAYILRSSYMDLVTRTAMLLGGPEHAQVVCRAVRELNQSETFEDYLTHLVVETDQRRAQRGN